MEEKKKDGRGGARAGAGRKKTLDKGSGYVGVILPPHLLKWVNSQPNKTKCINDILEDAYKDRGK